MIRPLALAAALLAALPGPALADDLAARFGARPGIEHASLSPDGRRIAFVVPRDGQASAILVQEATPGATATPVVRADGNPDRLAGCSWVSNRRLVCTLYGVVARPLDRGADVVRYTRLAAVDIDGKNVRLLERQRNDRTRGFATWGADVLDWLPGEENAILMARYVLPDDSVNTRIGSSAEGLGVERVDTTNLRATRVEPPRLGAAYYRSDGRGTVRLMGIQQKDGTGLLTGDIAWMFRRKGSRTWEPFSTFNTRTEAGFDPAAIDPDADLVYGFRKVDGRMAIWTRPLDGSDRETLVLARPDVDVDRLVTFGRQRHVVGASFATDRRERVYFDPALTKLHTSLEKALPPGTHLSFASASEDERRLLVWAGRDDDPGAWYLLNRDTGELATLMVTRPELEGVTLTKVDPIKYRAADGTMVPAYLTLPATGPRKGLPAIVLPHGGPSARDEWGFDWLSQFFAAKGYAVIQPNFRGSAGYGEAWLQENGFKSWKVAISDVLDAGRHLVNAGIADPAKLGIVGWGYGGYAALQSAATDPSLFKAVIAIAPVTDLEMFRDEWRNFTSSRLEADVIGTGPHIREGAPSQNAARIIAPVLLFHGALDRNVSIRQSQRMAERLKAANRPVTLVTWDNLDHYLEDSRARTQLLRESDAFLRAGFGG